MSLQSLMSQNYSMGHVSINSVYYPTPFTVVIMWRTSVAFESCGYAELVIWEDHIQHMACAP